MVAILRSIFADDSDSSSGPVSIDLKNYTHSIFKSWDLDEIPNSLLLFLSINDRVIYITISEDLEKYITTDELNEVISICKVFLAEQKYAQAILHGILNLKLILQSNLSDIKEKENNKIKAYDNAGKSFNFKQLARKLIIGYSLFKLVEFCLYCIYKKFGYDSNGNHRGDDDDNYNDDNDDDNYSDLNKNQIDIFDERNVTLSKGKIDPKR